MAEFAVYLLAAYLGSAALLVYVLLCGDSDFHRNGLIGKLHEFITHSLWVYLRKYGTKICGRGFFGKVDKCGHWCCNQRNPMMQIFYLFLVVGGSGSMVYLGWKYIPGPFLHEFHKYLFLGVFTATVSSFYYVCTKDPGVVTAENVHTYNGAFQYDNLIFSEKYCESCKLMRPARTKHCRVCNRCVSRFDHHCAWINTDVGLHNIREFLLFLLLTAMLCFYVAFLCFQIERGVIHTNNLFSLTYKNEQQMDVPVPATYVMQFLMYHTAPLIGLGLFAFFCALVLFAFFSYHVFLVITNTTTNETFKWKELKWALKELEHQRATAHQAVQGRNMPAVALKKIKNIYNRGFVNNFKEVLFPHRLRNYSKSAPSTPVASPATTSSGASEPIGRKGKPRRN